MLLDMKSDAASNSFMTETTDKAISNDDFCNRITIDDFMDTSFKLRKSEKDNGNLSS
jgi:hypothetical protein